MIQLLVVEEQRGPRMEYVGRVIVLVDHTAIRPGELDGVCHDRRQHVLKVEA